MDTPSQESTPNQPNEAGFSTNLYLTHSRMGRVQFTFRGATSRDWGSVLEDVDRFLQYMHGKGWKFDGEPAAAAPAGNPPPSQPQEPTRKPIDDSGNEQPEVKSFKVDRLSFETKDGKYYYKVIGPKFPKWGVKIWPEVLVDAGFDVDEDGAPQWDQVPHIAGWTAIYIETEKNGQMVPLKVTRLLPSKPPY